MDKRSIVIIYISEGAAGNKGSFTFCCLITNTDLEETLTLIFRSSDCDLTASCYTTQIVVIYLRFWHITA